MSSSMAQYIESSYFHSAPGESGGVVLTVAAGAGAVPGHHGRTHGGVGDGGGVLPDIV